MTTEVTPAERVAAINAQIQTDIATEVERRVSEWMQASHGVDFVSRLNTTIAVNRLLKAHNQKFYLLLKQAHQVLDAAAKEAKLDAEPPLNYQIRLVIEAAEKGAEKRKSKIEIVR